MNDNKANDRRHAESLFDEIREELERRNFSSMAEVQEFAAAKMHQRNSASLDDFQGLSPDQMRRLMWNPFDCPDLVTFAEAPEHSIDAPIMRLIALIIEAIGEKGVRLTQKGNLPLKIVASTVLAYLGDEDYQKLIQYSALRSEQGYQDLHIARLVAGSTGLTRKQHGRLMLTRKCLALMTKGKMVSHYPILLREYATRFNWAYRGYGTQHPIIQETFLFTVYLLHLFGDEWRNITFYEDAFIRAFPQIIAEVPPTVYSTSEERVRTAYSCSALNCFAVFMGLVERRYTGEDFFNRNAEIRKLPLLDEAIGFTL